MSIEQNLLENIVADPRYLSNLDWGQARPGHPEGTVRAHIAELEQNLESLRSKLTAEECAKLKILIHTHDTFKAESQPGVSILDPKSHASLAVQFLSLYCDDADLLAMVQYHDEPYALYRQFESKGTWNAARFERLLKAISNWDLFLAFNIIDGCTVGKSREPLKWFFRELKNRVATRFSDEEIL